MTRAKDELYLTGALTPGKKPETQLKDSWYEAVETALRPTSQIETGADGQECAIIFPADRPDPSPPIAKSDGGRIDLTQLTLDNLPPIAPRLSCDHLRPLKAAATSGFSIRCWKPWNGSIPR
ncbi:hypothetical protein PSQ19_15725 [Devosia algicola]|uniref:Uncharacterized protein n=1 Tax=Devosia algicola TaxID=3026418 RepID=A0ABY7YLM6_9HYPH|nr:hypothetical protein [Devosia algicola]WDR02102.1 hypothetical protein PSQ19_15725 [Devosia algicola]